MLSVQAKDVDIGVVVVVVVVVAVLVVSSGKGSHDYGLSRAPRLGRAWLMAIVLRIVVGVVVGNVDVMVM